MNLIAAGTNHKYSPIGFRERISFSKRRLNEALLFLVGLNNIRGAVILSTCNRVEIYANVPYIEEGFETLVAFFSRYHEVDVSRLVPFLYKYEGKEALRHLCEVASGLNSQILGEAEILGQVRFFYEEAKRLGFTDVLLDKVFNWAIYIGKIVRDETEISKGKVSMGSLVIELIKREVKAPREKKVLIVGMGKISELVIKYLLKEEISIVFVSNRTYERAKEIAESIGANAVRFDRFKENLKNADIVISATSSPHVVLKKDDLAGIDKPLLIIDLALPRDVDPDVRDVKGVKLFNLDDLGSIIEENLTKKEFEAQRACLIVDREIDKLWGKFIELEQEEALLR